MKERKRERGKEKKKERNVEAIYYFKNIPS